MAMRILWPNLPAPLVPVATEAVGPGFQTEFCEKFADVTDAQWANADAIVGGCLPQYIDKLRHCIDRGEYSQAKALLAKISTRLGPNDPSVSALAWDLRDAEFNGETDSKEG